ncbi:MAG: hypothetical protein V4535_05225 [Bacteroidota bacterium]
MAKQIYLFFFILVSGISFSQNVNGNVSEIKELLCTTWNIDYGLSNGIKMQGIETYLNEYSFEPDNTYKISGPDAEPTIGNWKLNPEKNRIELYTDKGISGGYITFLDKNHFVIIPDEESVPEDTKLEFFFKPKK